MDSLSRINICTHPHTNTHTYIVYTLHRFYLRNCGLATDRLFTTTKKCLCGWAWWMKWHKKFSTDKVAGPSFNLAIDWYVCVVRWRCSCDISQFLLVHLVTAFWSKWNFLFTPFRDETVRMQFSNCFNTMLQWKIQFSTIFDEDSLQWFFFSSFYSSFNSLNC